jgi:hypothetical protein
MSNPPHDIYYGAKPPSHGHYNLDAAAYDRAFSQGLFYRYLKQFPRKYRTAVGTATLFTAGSLIYLAIKPSKTNRPVRTMTPEWKEATEILAEKQNDSPISHYKAWKKSQ